MSKVQGNLSIDSENIFPIIKKWLYSDHDIFIRELVSNGCDAITKLKKLDLISEVEIPEGYKNEIKVIADANKKTLTFIDTGIGMTEDEVKEYINQIAFSGATDFLEKYKDKASEEQIIGHFGLGFYSAFMVADKVTIDTLSYKEGAEPIFWESEGGMSFSMDKGTKDSWGTKITLYLNEDCYEFANSYRVKEILNKYCSFMPVEIFFEDANAEQEYETIDAADVKEDDVVVERFTEEAKTEEKENEKGEKEVVEISPAKEKAKINKRPVSISTPTPLWTKHPNECSEEEYKKFYREVFHDYKEPLFWIHLNMDYPFNLKGILYFPKVNTEYDNLEGTIKLYNNQVFIADNIKEVIPEFLLLLKGVIDCPDLPLNVSRSALQNDGFVKKISEYITKKVADKLSGMFKVERENYEKYWNDISPFIKFGCLKDEKFQEKMKEYIIFQNLDEKFITLPDYVKAATGVKDGEAVDAEGNVIDAEVETDTKENADEKKEEKTTIYYVTDLQQQSQYVNLFKEQGKDALVLTHAIDQPFISRLEQLNDDLRFQRVDAELDSEMTEADDSEEFKKNEESLSALFKSNLKKDQLQVELKKLKNTSVSSMITLSEDSRRMQDMMKQYGMAGMDPAMFGNAGETLVLNANHPLVAYLLKSEKDEKITKLLCQQLYDLAAIAQRPLPAEEMTQFVARSNEVMIALTK